MVRIWQKRKLILIVGIAALISVFFIGKSIPVVYGQWAKVGGIIYSPEGYFLSDNSIFGGPQCAECLQYRTEYYQCGKKTCSRRVCVVRRTGLSGNFTEDSACRTAYGQSVSARSDFFNDANIQINICDFSSSKASSIDCIVQQAFPNTPSPIVPPCAQWKDGVCEKIDTSLFQGGEKDKGSISANPAEFIVRIFTIILGFAGGIALLLIISAGYKIIMSKGKPEAIQLGREQLVSAIIGLVFIIFSFVIFQLVVTDILKIPGIIK